MISPSVASARAHSSSGSIRLAPATAASRSVASVLSTAAESRARAHRLDTADLLALQLPGDRRSSSAAVVADW